MGTNAEQIEQLIEAVKLQPGSPAYAALAEHYAEQGNLEAAVEVCEAGFEANPGYERGALAYLSVLRRTRDHRRASEVFGRAVAYVPRSAKLRVEWALILAEAGRDNEARRYAREALDLAPLNREARALVATLGEAASAFGSATAPADDDSNILQDEEAQEEVGSLSAQARLHRATVRPRVRPAGQGATPHQLFDLTPGPAAVDPEERARRRGPESSPFDITPMPEPGSPPPMEGESDSVPEAPPSPSAAVQRGEELPPAAPPPVPRTVSATGAARPATATARAGARPPDPVPTSRTRPRRRRLWLWLPILLLLLGGGGAAAFLMWREAQREEIRAAAQDVLASTRPDVKERYLAARQRLANLHGQNPNDSRIRTVLAWVEAVLATRFDGDDRRANTARQLLAGGDGSLLARAAEVLAAVAAGSPPKVDERLPDVDDRRAWPVRLAAVTALLDQGRVPDALRILDAATEQEDAAPALLFEAARLARLARQEERARQLLDRGLEASADHTGLRVESLLLDAQQGSHPNVDQLRALMPMVEGVPRYAAALSLARALVMGSQGDREAALTLARQARDLQPEEPEYGMQLASLWLAPGGDATKALELLREHVPRMIAFDRAAPLELARSLLLLGRPGEAMEVLEAMERDALQPETRRQHRQLMVWSVHTADDRKRLHKLCRRAAKPADASTVLCAEALLDRSKIKWARRLRRTVKDRGARRYLAGLQALVLGDGSAAVEWLEKVSPEAALVNPVRKHLTLARAHQDQGDPARAVELLREAVVLDAQSVRSRAALADALVAGGHDSEAQRVLEGVVAARPTAPSLLSLTAETFLALGLPHKAHAMLGNAPARIRRSASMRLVAGRVALANKHLKEAATLFNAILKDDPRSPDALMELGRLESARGHQTKARAYFARALKLRPRDPELYEALSQVHARSGRPAKAITYGMRAADLFRERNRPLRACEALIALGRSLRAGDKRSVIKAEEILFEATKIPGAPARAYLELGLVHKKKDDLNRAAWCFRQAGRRDPQLAEAHLQLGLALSRKRKRHWRREAVQALRRFLKLRPKGEKADLAKARLKAL